MKRIFVAFAMEDRALRDMLRGQARNPRTPIEFVDMSVKEPWDSQWKTNCRVRIRGCDGVIGLITANTMRADGQQWELQCAYDEGIPVLLVYGGGDDGSVRLPSTLNGRRVFRWTWDTISGFIEKL